jgi:hypothetical protein
MEEKMKKLGAFLLTAVVVSAIAFNTKAEGGEQKIMV